MFALRPSFLYLSRATSLHKSSPSSSSFTCHSPSIPYIYIYTYTRTYTSLLSFPTFSSNSFSSSCRDSRFPRDTRRRRDAPPHSAVLCIFHRFLWNSFSRPLLHPAISRAPSRTRPSPRLSLVSPSSFVVTLRRVHLGSRSRSRRSRASHPPLGELDFLRRFSD